MKWLMVNCQWLMKFQSDKKMKKLSFILVFFLLTVSSYSQSVTCGKMEIELKKDSMENKTAKIGIGLHRLDRYPSTALEKGIQGTVKVGYDIDDNCQIKNVKIIEGLGYGLDEIALEYLKCLQLELDKIEKENCFELRYMVYPVRFKIQETKTEKPVQKSSKGKKRKG